jgi:pyridoxal phosphate enzyme (YggS family)
MSDIGASIAAVRQRVDRACTRAGRSPDDVRVVAISKTFSVERIGELVNSGHTLLGENLVQEALRKIPRLGPEVRWHFVGHLQRNKARDVAGVFELIHSVDSERLAGELNRRAGRAGVRQAILVQVNLSQEASKFGVGEEELPGLLEAVAALDHLDIRGLMTIPPPVEHAEDSRPWFVKLRELRDRLAGTADLALPELSMGMTDDFEIAVEEGATLVRVGRAIFGERPPV